MDRLQVKGGPGKINAILHGAEYNQQRRAIPDSIWETWTTPPTNYIGTALFLSYIIAALALTVWILTQDILRRWPSRTNGHPRTRMLLATATISFSVLSANMILFLYRSYISFLESADLQFSLKHLGPWMLNTNLFTSFARQLLANEKVTTWTIQGLLMTMLIGGEMSSLGRRYNMKNLWTYFCLGQILPPSFAYFLLHLRTHLQDLAEQRPRQGKKPAAKRVPTSTIVQTLSTAIILFITTASILSLKAVTTADSDWRVLSKVLWLRSLLFLPLFISSVSIFNIRIFRVIISQQCLLLVSFLLASYTRNNPLSSLTGFIFAGFSNPAIRTLGSDWVIKGGVEIISVMID